MLLSDLKCRTAKPKDKPYKLTDGRGLYLVVQPNGSKLWRFDYSYGEKRKTFSLGAYPEITLAAARGGHSQNMTSPPGGDEKSVEASYPSQFFSENGVSPRNLPGGWKAGSWKSPRRQWGTY
jgi:hypothetical protein